MSESSRILENNLKKFLLDAFEKSDSPHHATKFRYNNLKLYIRQEISTEPHFCVNIGSTDACFSLEKRSKIKGHIGSDERYIIRWASRPGIKKMLEELWQSAQTAETPVPAAMVSPPHENTAAVEPRPEKPATQTQQAQPAKKKLTGFADLYRSMLN
jgi:hypothetical protein